jgi:uncharacterized protein YukE
MGDDELRVERAALKRNAEGFGSGAKTLEQIFDRLNSALSAEGKCWGADDTGKAFESNYTKPEQSALKTFPSLVKSLGDIENGVKRMADNYNKAEEASGG